MTGRLVLRGVSYFLSCSSWPLYLLDVLRYLHLVIDTYRKVIRRPKQVDQQMNVPIDYTHFYGRQHE